MASVRYLVLFGWLLGIFACGGSGSDPAPPPITGIGVERVDQALEGIMARHAPPGIAVAVVRDGRLVIARAVGHADLAGTEPLAPDHLFRVASVSKPVTGIAVMRAVEEGLLTLDARAFDVLASYLPASGADPRLGDITVQHLTWHGGGWDLYGYPNDPLFRSLEVAEALQVPLPPDPQALTRWAAMQPLAFDPGSRSTYTNIGIVVLGRVIETATGFSYEDFVQRFVLGPAGIGRATLGGISRSERLPGEVEYESFRNEIWKSVFDGRSIVDEPAYGGLNLLGFDASSAWVFSAIDLARLAAATDGDPGYPDILSADSVATMTRRLSPTGSTPMGITWFLGILPSGDTNEWNHSGGMPGTTSFLGRLPNGVILAVASNTAREPVFFDDLLGDLVEAVNGISEWPTTDLFPQFP